MNTGANITQLREDDDEEGSSWREMPFFPYAGEEAGNSSVWQPMRFESTTETSTQAYVADGAIGDRYAAALIGHMRQYNDDCGVRLVQVAEAIVRGGVFGTVERAFFGAIGEYIATGKIAVSLAFDARLADDNGELPEAAE